ncbi:MAG: hypothetical protein LQ352_002410 [Teloschistes flavicans]|nr:MAG: hypothetical protein LQ352_002410 [Teloschistes flavicans]
MTRLPPISSLMSPPEAKPIDSFSSAVRASQSPSVSQKQPFSPDNKLAPLSNQASPNKSARILPSPPVSPWASKQYKERSCKASQDDAEEAFATKDPLLYPESQASSRFPIDQPLFPSEPSMKAAQELVSRHIATHKFKNTVATPTRYEYLLALSCVSTVGRNYNHNPAAYLKRAREETEDQYWKAKRICGKPGIKPTSHVPIAPAPPPKQSRRTIKATPTSSPVPRVKRTPKATPKASPMSKLMNYPAKGRSETPEARPQGAKRPEDVDYISLDDYSPPTSTLPHDNPKSLKVDWPSTNVLDLSNDPDRQMLHEAELHLAGTLRLSCATYLCSKRRIFAARLQALRIGKEFRKTDAQQACKIDVNKASKLWTIYDKVGWFDQAYFERYLLR